VDNASQDAATILQSLLRFAGVGGDDSAERSPDNPQEKVEGTRSVSMLEAIRMLVTMAPEERSALVELIKALG